MPSNITNIPAPRVDLIDPRTGLMSREWYRFFLNLFNVTGSGNNPVSLDDIQVGPPAITEIFGELGIVYDQAQISSMLSQYEQNVQNVQNQLDNQPSFPQLGTLSSINEDNVRLIGFSTSPSPAVPNPAPTGTLYWDGNSTLGLQMNQSVLARIGQAQFVYVKASAAITKGQLCKHTGSVGGSGVITAEPTSINMTDPNQIVGVAAEDIALNGFGFIQTSGDIRGFNTTGSSVGEVWADGDPLYYNPSFVGSFTKTKPSAPNLKSYIGEIINAGSGGSGSLNIRMQPGSILGGTDSNVQFGVLADKDLIQYDNALKYWKNVAFSTVSVGTATNLSGGAAGSVPYQSGAGTTTFLSVGTAGQVLQVNAGATAPEWVGSTGTGNVARATSPIFVTPTLGAASATSVIVNGSGGLGYGTGSGGAVTQGTSRTTGVTLNKTNGAITLFSAAGTTAWQSFTVTNSTVATTDTVKVSQKSGTDLYQIFVTAVSAGSFRITFATTGGTTTEQPVFNFAVIKAVTA